jgi:hypothetical protein
MTYYGPTYRGNAYERHAYPTRPPLAEHTETRDAGSIEITARTYGTDTPTVVVVRIRGNAGYWQCPDARTLRRIAARTAAAAGRTLTKGEPYTAHGYNPTGWGFTYATD